MNQHIWWNWTRLALLLTFSWCTMLVCHELGHLIMGYVGGAKLVDFDIVPWHLPYSFHSPDPHPLITLWGGPVLGISIPFAAFFCWRNAILRFVADFCLLANGCYIAVATWTGDHLLDSQRLLDAGAPITSLILFSALTITVGYLRFRQDCAAALSRSPRPKIPPSES